MYDTDPKPNSDQEYCPNCEMIVDKLDIQETYEGDAGCSECISQCDICLTSHFAQDMYLCTWFGRICNDCVKDEEYKKDVKDKVIQESLRCYFDETGNKRVEQKIIEVAFQLGYFYLADEMKNDKS